MLRPLEAAKNNGVHPNWSPSLRLNPSSSSLYKILILSEISTKITVCGKVENYGFLILFAMEGIGAVIQQKIDDFKTELLILMEASVEDDGLFLFVREVDDLLSVGLGDDLFNTGEISKLINKYFCLMASLSYCILNVLGSYMSLRWLVNLRYVWDSAKKFNNLTNMKASIIKFATF